MNSLDDGLFIFLLLYVNDMLIVTKSMIEVSKLKILLSIEFDMKDLGVAKKIRRDRVLGRLWLSWRQNPIFKFTGSYIIDKQIK